MNPLPPPDPNPAPAVDWNQILPDEEESVFNHMVYCLVDDVHNALRAGALLAPPGQTGGHALIYAVWGRDFGLLRDLLEHGFNPNQLAYTDEGEVSLTALDAVADSYHDGAGKIDEMVLDAMHALLREYGGQYACELSIRPSVESGTSEQP